MVATRAEIFAVAAVEIALLRDVVNSKARIEGALPELE